MKTRVKFRVSAPSTRRIPMGANIKAVPIEPPERVAGDHIPILDKQKQRREDEK